MTYPVVLTKSEYEQMTGKDLDSYFETPDTETEVFLHTASALLFENVIYPAGNRERANRIIAAYSEVTEQIKEILILVIDYLLKGENMHLYSGVIAQENGDENLKDMQEIIQRILPPNIKTYVMNISPSIVYAGGFR